MIQRIAKRIRDRAGPRLELFEGGGVAGAIALVDSVGAHGPPLVVVAFEPDLGQVMELPVVRYVARRKMTVIVENGLVLGVGVIEMP